MLEQTGEKEILITDPMAEMFIERLIDVVDLRDKIAKDELPFGYWNEISIQPRGSEKWPGYAKGLVYGVDHAVFDAWDSLHQLGYGMEANAIVHFKERI